MAKNAPFSSHALNDAWTQAEKRLVLPKGDMYSKLFTVKSKALTGSGSKKIGSHSGSDRSGKPKAK